MYRVFPIRTPECRNQSFTVHTALQSEGMIEIHSLTFTFIPLLLMCLCGELVSLACFSLLNMLYGSLGGIVNCWRGVLFLNVIVGSQVVPSVLLVIVDQLLGKQWLHLKKIIKKTPQETKVMLS